MRWCLLLTLAAGAMSAAAKADESTARDLIRQGQSAYDQRKFPQALTLATQAIEADPKNVRAYFLRGTAYEAERKHAEAVADYTRVIELDPQAAVAYDRRGNEQFRLGKMPEALQDYDKYVEMVPEERARHWRRGIACYYAGRFDDGARQFEAYQSVDSNDVENAVWRFLCMARAESLAAARDSLLKIAQDRRVPMMQIYGLFAGKNSPDDVLAAANAGEPDKAELRERLFYAHLYLGLYCEATGDTDGAREHLEQAAGTYALDHFMGDVARVHIARLKHEEPND
jgi:lipoprotein NlpI